MKKVVFIFALFLAFSASAQDRPIHEVYSMMVFNFTKYVQWPDHSASGEFTIGVMGNEDIYKTLNDWYGGKPRGNKTYVIKKFKNASEVTDCNVLFVDNSKSGEFEGVKAKVSGKGTLLITDKSGLGVRGSGINFTKADNKLKFELNQKVVESANLKVSSSLSAMAILI
jgi:hypothetical protein